MTQPMLIISAVVALILLIIMIKIFKSPLHLLLKLLFNAAIGVFLLIVFNHLGTFIDVTIEINTVTVLIAAIGGVPGFIILLVLKWFMII